MFDFVVTLPHSGKHDMLRCKTCFQCSDHLVATHTICTKLMITNGSEDTMIWIGFQRIVQHEIMSTSRCLCGMQRALQQFHVVEIKRCRQLLKWFDVSA